MEVHRDTERDNERDEHSAVSQVGAVPRLAQWVRDYWLVPILALAALTRVYDLTAAAIWGDEGSSLLLSQYSLAGIWFHAAHDVHPPLYFLLLHGWIELFGDGIFSIRSLSALPGIVTVGLGVWLVRLIATRHAAVLAGFLLAMLPTAVRYSQEVRMYSLLGVWLIGATIALVYWVKQPQRQRYLVIYVLLMTAGFYTHYFTALCVLSHWLYLLLIRLQPSNPCRLIARPGWWLANVDRCALSAMDSRSGRLDSAHRSVESQWRCGLGNTGHALFIAFDDLAVFDPGRGGQPALGVVCLNATAGSDRRGHDGLA